MKSLPASTVLRASLAAAASLLVVGVLGAQTESVLSAVPGARTTMALPKPDVDGVHLTLEQAIGLALANNTDLDVTVNAAQSFEYSFLSSKGIFDPLLQGFAN